MVDAGKIVIHDTANDLPGTKHPAGAIQGMTTTDGTIHLIAANINASTATPVLLHEMFHSGAENLLGQQRWQNLMRRVQGIHDAAVRRVREGRASESSSEEFWAEALRRVNDAGVPEGQRAEELAAYAIEHREAAPAGLRDVVDKLVGALKAWLLRRLGIRAGSVTSEQLRAVTISALRERGDGGREGSAFSFRSVAKALKAITDKAWRKDAGVVSRLRAEIGPVENWQRRIGIRLGLNMDGLTHSVDGSAIKHIHDRHSSEKGEAGRGQIAVKPSDILLIPDIIASPDGLVVGGVSDGGLQVIGYIKKMRDGSTLYIEEVRTGRRQLATNSMRRYPAAKRARSIARTLASNGQTDGGDKLTLVETSLQATRPTLTSMRMTAMPATASRHTPSRRPNRRMRG